MNLSKIKYKYKMTDRPVDRYRKMDKLFCMVMASILKQLFSFIIHVHYTVLQCYRYVHILHFISLLSICCNVSMLLYSN